MPRYLRPRRPGATLFLTICLADRRSALLTDRIDLLRRTVMEVKDRHPFTTRAWVVLPDHMHCIWTLPEGDDAYSRRVAAIKAGFSRELRRAGFIPPSKGFIPPVKESTPPSTTPTSPRHLRKGESGIWQRRFWEHHIRDETDFTNHLRYCEMNPVKHGLAERPEDWPWSSFNVGRGLPRHE